MKIKLILLITLFPSLYFAQDGNNTSKTEVNVIQIEDEFRFQVSANQENLISNPLSSALDFQKLLHSDSNKDILGGSIYLREVYSSSLAPGLGTFTISESGLISYVPGIRPQQKSELRKKTKSSHTLSRILPSGKEFIVIPNQEGELKVSNDDIADLNSFDFQFNYKSISSLGFSNRVTKSNFSTSELRRARVKIGFGDDYSRELLINLHPSFTEDFDFGYEAHSPKDVKSDAYLGQETPLVIQALKFQEDIKIPITVNLHVTKDISITFIEEGAMSVKKAFLFDSETGKYYNLENQSFRIYDLPKGTYTDRFFITFKNQIFEDKEEIGEKIKFVVDNRNEHISILNPQLLPIDDIRLYDLKGMEHIDTKSIPVQEKYEIPVSKLNDGIYVASLRLDNKRKYSQKLVLKKLP